MSTPYFLAGSKQRAANARTRQKLIAKGKAESRIQKPESRSWRYAVATPWGDSSSTGRVGAVDRAAAEAIVRSLYPGHVLKSLEAI